jgi:hypothetical protein
MLPPAIAGWSSDLAFACGLCVSAVSFSRLLGWGWGPWFANDSVTWSAALDIRRWTLDHALAGLRFLQART